MLIASVGVKSGPPLSPRKGRPSRVNSTVRTCPSGVLGLSAGERTTASTLLFGNSETYFCAATSAAPSNHRQVTIFGIAVSSSFARSAG